MRSGEKRGAKAFAPSPIPGAPRRETLEAVLGGAAGRRGRLSSDPCWRHHRRAPSGSSPASCRGTRRSHPGKTEAFFSILEKRFPVSLAVCGSLSKLLQNQGVEETAALRRSCLQRSSLRIEGTGGNAAALLRETPARVSGERFLPLRVKLD